MAKYLFLSNEVAILLRCDTIHRFVSRHTKSLTTTNVVDFLDLTVVFQILHKISWLTSNGICQPATIDEVQSRLQSECPDRIKNREPRPRSRCHLHEKKVFFSSRISLKHKLKCLWCLKVINIATWKMDLWKHHSK